VNTACVSNWTKQSAFDLICNRFAVQKVRSHDPAVTEAEGNGCLYRGPDGTKCAVGHLIADADYLPVMEGRGVNSDEVRGVLKSDEDDFLRFLVDVQVSHDGSDSPEKLRKNLRVDAHRYDLDPAAVDLITEWA